MAKTANDAFLLEQWFEFHHLGECLDLWVASHIVDTFPGDRYEFAVFGKHVLRIIAEDGLHAGVDGNEKGRGHAIFVGNGEQPPDYTPRKARLFAEFA